MSNYAEENGDHLRTLIELLRYQLGYVDRNFDEFKKGNPRAEEQLNGWCLFQCDDMLQNIGMLRDEIEHQLEKRKEEYSK